MPSSLRVLHVISSMSPLRGGPSVTVHRALRALRLRGIAADVVTTDDDGGTARLDVPLDRFMELEGQRIRYFPRQTLRYGFSAPLLSWLRANIARYDIVHTHELFTFAPLAAARLARAADIPYLMTPHGALDTWGMRNKSRLVKAASIRLLEGPLMARAAAVNFMTPLEQSRAEQHGLSFRPMVLPVGVVDPQESRHEPPRRGDDTPLDGQRTILFLARIHPIKSVDVLLRAYAGLDERESVLVIAGGGDRSLVESLQRLAAGLGLGERVRWVGFVSGAEKLSLLARASLFVLPSASENYGIAAVEAMQSAIPVIVTSGCGLAEFVRRNAAGIVTDGSVSSLRSALARLLADSELCRSTGEAGRRAVQRELSIDTFGDRLERAYRLLREDGPRPVSAASPAL
jgi:glycosyltransferase involved in cell wall biosynthesis